MVSRDAPIGSRHDGPVRVANGDNRKSLDHDEILKATATPSYLLKIIALSTARREF